jgi:TetR/AcrR family transcriptional repressor of lmrAB and yxaGH operons
MRAQKVDSGHLDQMLFDVFSRFGYDGASMDLLSKATGLKKASLYHRFPEGKKEMAHHVLEMVKQWIESNILAPLMNSEAKKEQKLKSALAAIDELYHGGANNCLLRTLTIGTDADDFKTVVSDCFDLLISGFEAIALDFGASAAKARQKAKQVNLMIQGALVLANATADKSYFKHALTQISYLIKNPS